MKSRLPVLLAAVVAALATAAPALAAGGSYVFDGGTPRQQAEVRRALEASAFDFGVVQETITVHVERGTVSRALPGHVWLDADLLDAGKFSWATVQDEFAHQVDFLLFDDTIRQHLTRALGARDWCYGVRGLPHAAYGCERFASTLVWAYWPSKANTYRPRSKRDESAALPPAAFRALLGDLLATRAAASAAGS